MSNKKRILWKMVFISLAVFIVSAAGFLVTGYIQRRFDVRREQAWVQNREAQIRGYRNYLQETAKRVTILPVDPNIVGQAQARYFEEYPKAHLFLWGTDTSGQFLFGIPREAFARLNRAYDSYQKIIEQEGRFTDRQDFIRRLVQSHRELTFDYYEKRLAGEASSPPKAREDKLDGYDQEGLVFSAPFQNERGEMLGNLYLKVTDIQDSSGGSPYFDFREPRDASSFLFVASLLFLWFLLPSWVYLDAKGRGMESPVRWAILAFISLFIGLAVYLLLRPEEGVRGTCPRCGRTVNEDRFCPYCGSPATQEFCPKCGYPARSEWTYCPNCQTALWKAPDQPVAPPTEKVPPTEQSPVAGEASQA